MVKYVNQLLSSLSKPVLERYLVARGATRIIVQDFDLWTQSFGSRYIPAFVTSKDSGEIVSTGHAFEYINIHDKASKLCYGGLLWVDKNHRGRKLLIHLTKLAATYPLVKYPFHGNMKSTSTSFFRIFTGENNEFYTSHYSFYDKSELKIDNIEKKDNGIILKKLSEVSPDLLTNYDQSVFPYDRETYIKEYMKQDHCYSRIALNPEGKVIGYGSIINYSHSGTAAIQPLYADNADIARNIVVEILREENLDFQRLYLRTNEDTYTWLQPLLKDGVEARRKKHSVYRYSKEPPKGFDMNKCFAFASSKVCPI